MVYVLMVISVVAAFALTAFLAHLFHIERFGALLALVGGFAFLVPAGVATLVSPDPGIPREEVSTAFGVAVTLVVMILAARALQRRARRRGGARGEPRPSA